MEHGFTLMRRIYTDLFSIVLSAKIRFIRAIRVPFIYLAITKSCQIVTDFLP
jgi:hypothetical protein